LAWTIEYTETSRRQLKKLDRQVARRMVDFMDQRVAKAKDPRSLGKALSGVLGAFWRYRVGDYRIIVSIEDKRIRILVVAIGNRREVYR
jgi:mRNA interferase RelE/StbE